jgi:hypothetical protein
MEIIVITALLMKHTQREMKFVRTKIASLGDGEFYVHIKFCFQKM